MTEKRKSCFTLLRFAMILLAVIVIADIALSRSGWIQESGYFYLNDFEITKKHHPESPWESVIYGSSELVSGYREDLSEVNYVNLGMDYALVTDLAAMLEKRTIGVEENLVIALNWGALCADLDKCPTYEWYRKPLEPYVYFQRDRLSGFIKDEFGALIGSNAPRTREFLNQEKETYHGCMTQEELGARVVRLNGLFFTRGVDGFTENIAALERVFEFCEINGITVRVLWLPENPSAPMGEINNEVRALAAKKCADSGIEFYDMTDALEPECFYDTGHINYEVGAPIFTEVLDKWLMQ